MEEDIQALMAQLQDHPGIDELVEKAAEQLEQTGYGVPDVWLTDGVINSIVEAESSCSEDYGHYGKESN